MTYVEVQLKSNEIMASCITKLILDLSFEDAVKYAVKGFTPSTKLVYIQNEDDDKLLKIEMNKNQLVKSFVLDLFNFKEGFK